jgi:hypothetical protein
MRETPHSRLGIGCEPSNHAFGPRLLEGGKVELSRGVQGSGQRVAPVIITVRKLGARIAG